MAPRRRSQQQKFSMGGVHNFNILTELFSSTCTCSKEPRNNDPQCLRHADHDEANKSQTENTFDGPQAVCFSK